MPANESLFLGRFSTVYTGSAIGVSGKERVNRTPMTRKGADNRG